MEAVNRQGSDTWLCLQGCDEQHPGQPPAMTPSMTSALRVAFKSIATLTGGHPQEPNDANSTTVEGL